MNVGLLPSIYTIEIGEKPILSFMAANIRQAQELCREQWLRDDLTEATSNGVSIWDGKSRMRARLATEKEALQVATLSQSAEPSDGLLLVYHVELDS